MKYTVALGRGGGGVHCSIGEGKGAYTVALGEGGDVHCSIGGGGGMYTVALGRGGGGRTLLQCT